MADVLTPEQRHNCMSSVRRENTSPELFLRSILHKAGLRYRLHDRRLRGSPDIVFPRFRAVLFVHGCYWHSHGCYKATLPRSRRKFWKEKFRQNRERDMRDVRSLCKENWRVMIVWQCALKGKESFSPDEIVNIIQRWLHSSDSFCECPNSRASFFPVSDSLDAAGGSASDQGVESCSNISS